MTEPFLLGQGMYGIPLSFPNELLPVTLSKIFSKSALEVKTVADGDDVNDNDDVLMTTMMATVWRQQ